MNIDDKVVYAVGTVLGTVLSWLGYRKVSRDNRVADATAQADESTAQAYDAIIERMIRETERMSKVNDSLAEKANAAQLDNIQLRAEIALLRDQISKFRETELLLREEVEALKAEVTRLRTSRGCPTCDNCKVA